MPRLKTREVPFHKMQLLLRSHGMNGVQLGKVIERSHVTAKKKIENPALLTLGDLDKINKRIPIPWDEIREAIVR